MVIDEGRLRNCDEDKEDAACRDSGQVAVVDRIDFGLRERIDHRNDVDESNVLLQRYKAAKQWWDNPPDSLGRITCNSALRGGNPSERAGEYWLG